MVDVDQRTLLELLKASLFKNEPNIPAETDWNNVFEIARKQALVALAEYSVPDRLRSSWKTETSLSKKHYM